MILSAVSLVGGARGSRIESAISRGHDISRANAGLHESLRTDRRVASAHIEEYAAHWSPAERFSRRAKISFTHESLRQVAIPDQAMASEVAAITATKEYVSNIGILVQADTDFRLLTTGEYSDLVIRRGDDEYNVHKAIVCAQSKWFRLACKPGTFKVCT